MSLFSYLRTAAKDQPASPVLPNEGLSVEDLEPSSTTGPGWVWSTLDSPWRPSGCCAGGLWAVMGRPLEDVAHRLASCGWWRNEQQLISPSAHSAMPLHFNYLVQNGTFDVDIYLLILNILLFLLRFRSSSSNNSGTVIYYGKYFYLKSTQMSLETCFPFNRAVCNLLGKKYNNTRHIENRFIISNIYHS